VLRVNSGGGGVCRAGARKRGTNGSIFLRKEKKWDINKKSEIDGGKKISERPRFGPARKR